MLNSIISKWSGSIEINGNKVDKNFNTDSIKGPIQLILYPDNNNYIKELKEEFKQDDNKVRDVQGTYRISVKRYMTKPATPEFDFMATWNNNIPMPLMTMVGDKIKETNGMVYMKLHGDITERVTENCLCCGKPITNPVSKYFGMGPVCGNHNYVNPFNSVEELKDAIKTYRCKLQSITWEGWIIKSAITEEVEL